MAAHVYAWILWVDSCSYNALYWFPAHVAGLGRWFGC